MKFNFAMLLFIASTLTPVFSQNLATTSLNLITTAVECTNLDCLDKQFRSKGYLLENAIGSKKKKQGWGYVKESIVAGRNYDVKTYYFHKYDSNGKLAGQIIAYLPDALGRQRVVFNGNRSIIESIRNEAEKKRFAKIKSGTSYGIFSVNMESTKFKLDLIDGVYFDDPNPTQNLGSNNGPKVGSAQIILK